MWVGAGGVSSVTSAPSPAKNNNRCRSTAVNSSGTFNIRFNLTIKAAGENIVPPYISYNVQQAPCKLDPFYLILFCSE